MRSVFGQLYHRLHKVSVDTYFMLPVFSFKLTGFGSTDACGPYLNLFSQLGMAIMTPHPNRHMQLNPLFVKCGRAGITAVMLDVPLLSCARVPLMPECFGKLWTSSSLTSNTLFVKFPPLLWKQLVNKDASIKDLVHLGADVARLIQKAELIMRAQDELQWRFPGIVDALTNVVIENQQLLLDGARLLSQKITANETDSFSEAMSHL